MTDAASKRASPLATRPASPSSTGHRSQFSGCSLEIMRMRVPASRIDASSGAWSKPSTVQSATKSAARRAAMAAGLSSMATEAPVDRMGNGPGLGGVGTTTSTGTTPREARARRAVSTTMGRLRVSDSTTATSRPDTRHASNWRA